MNYDPRADDAGHAHHRGRSSRGDHGHHLGFRAQVRDPARPPLQQPLRLLLERPADRDEDRPARAARAHRRGARGRPRRGGLASHVPRWRADDAQALPRRAPQGGGAGLPAHRHLHERGHVPASRVHRLRARARTLRVARVDPGRHRRGPRRDDRPRGLVPAHPARARRAAASRAARHREHVRQRAELSFSARVSHAARSLRGSPAARRHRAPGEHGRTRSSVPPRDHAAILRHGPVLRRDARGLRAVGSGLRRERRQSSVLHPPEVGLADPPRRPGDGDEVGGRGRPRRRDEQVRVARFIAHVPARLRRVRVPPAVHGHLSRLPPAARRGRVPAGQPRGAPRARSGTTQLRPARRTAARRAARGTRRGREPRGVANRAGNQRGPATAGRDRLRAPGRRPRPLRPARSRPRTRTRDHVRCVRRRCRC